MPLLLGSIKYIGQSRRPFLQGIICSNDEWNELPIYEETFDHMSYKESSISPKQRTTHVSRDQGGSHLDQEL